MKCSKCGHDSVVRDSRDGTCDAGGVLDDRRAWILNKVRQVWGWWSETDFKVRRRLCEHCHTQFYTVEIGLEDLRAALEDLRTPLVVEQVTILRPIMRLSQVAQVDVPCALALRPAHAPSTCSPVAKAVG